MFYSKGLILIIKLLFSASILHTNLSPSLNPNCLAIDMGIVVRNDWLLLLAFATNVIFP